MKPRFNPLVLFCAAVLLYATVLYSQALTINPSQTVNPATGEMGFSLPLGTVRGLSNHDFPINLSYKAGIQINQDAGPAGLGFSYGAGMIVRHAIMLQDNVTGYTETAPNHCDRAEWLKNLDRILMCVGICASSIVSAFVPGGEIIAVLFVSVMVEALLHFVNEVYSAAVFTPGTYLAGGYHVPSYKYFNSDGSVDPNAGKGFFKGGERFDCPDGYFLNSPFISGEFVWVGDPANGHFILKQSQGSTEKNNENVAIRYENDKFRITLADGTRLFFNDATRIAYNVALVGDINVDNGYCEYGIRKSQPAVNDQWYLTKVLYPDYTGSDESDVKTSNSGGWILFEYDVIEDELVRLSKWIQASNRDKVQNRTAINDMRFLRRVVTPNESAEFIYTYDRLDDVCDGPTETCTGTNDDGQPPIITYKTEPVLMPRLRDIFIRTATGETRSTIRFETNYSLRPNSNNAITNVPSMDGAWPCVPSDWYWRYNPSTSKIEKSKTPVNERNQQLSCLTLQSVRIIDKNWQKELPVTFEYGYNPALRRDLPLIRCPDGASTDNGQYQYYQYYNLEQKDNWGYYNTKGSEAQEPANDFNDIGQYQYTTKAHAWSLSKVTLPSGMSVAWDYEPNRYDMSNNIAVSSGGGQPRFGDGIRVKRITTNNGLGKDEIVSYFYTDMATPGTFEEADPAQAVINNSSGHATVEPFPYYKIASDDYRTNPQTRGGLYTPAKVTYERTIAVKGYRPGQTPKAPYGYSVYDFITSKDFPNGGCYGEFDESWRRGYVKRVAQYTSAGICVNERKFEYDWHPTSAISWGGTEYADDVHLITTGTVRQRRITDITKGVTSTTEYTFADELSNAGSDRVERPAGSWDAFTYTIIPWDRPYQEVEVFPSMHDYLIGDPSGPDVIALLHSHGAPGGSGSPNYYYESFQLMVACDFEINSRKQQPATPPISTIISFMNNNTSDEPLTVAGFWIDKHDGAFDAYVKCMDSRGGGEGVYYKIGNIRLNGNTINNDVSVEVGAVSGAVANNESVVGMYNTNWLFARVPVAYSVDRDGRYNRAIKYNSNGEALVDEVTPAFTNGNYAGMLTKHMLAYDCATTKKLKLPDNSEGVVSAAAKTWCQPASGVWQPKDNFVWRGGLDANGHPLATPAFAAFNHTPGAANANWVYQGGNETWDNYIRVVETAVPDGAGNKVYSSAMLGYGGKYPVASITNARLQDCLYTGFEDKQLSDFEKSPGTVAAIISNGSAKAGTQCLSITTSGGSDQYVRTWPVTATGLSNRTFFIEFWARGSAGTTGTATIRTATASYGQKAFTLNNSWRKIRYTCNFPVTSENSFRLELRAGNTDGVTVFYDEVRVYPGEAQMSTTTYDPVMGLATSVADINHNIRSVEFDGFGRPTAAYNTSGQKTKSTSYRVMNEKPFTLLGNPIQNSLPANDSKVDAISALLQWYGGEWNRPWTYQVYFGTTNPPPFVADVGANLQYTVTGIVLSTIYYWQIKSVQPTGETTSGPVWTFHSANGKFALTIERTNYDEILQQIGLCYRYKESSSSAVSSIEAGTTVTLICPSRLVYKMCDEPETNYYVNFVKWNVIEGGAQIDPATNTFVMPNNNVSVQTQYMPPPD
jgi:hypothetical protein